MIAIIDYGLGNISAFANILKKLNVLFTIATNPEVLETANKIILPGVGAFDHAMDLLDSSGMRNSLERKVIQDKVPVIGICVGMQILGKSSDEGVRSGLGWIDGHVRKFDVRKMKADTNLPHMGWNDVTPTLKSPLFAGLEENALFYFLHSYYFECKKQENVLAFTDYNFVFASAVCCENIYGVQFHPEKSHHFGIQLLKNFSEI
jgi:imidazole glycerol-phosphate synthase subunit HisH